MQDTKRKRRGGFTLLELLAVITVLATIIAVSISTFATARKQSNETSAVASLRTVSTAQLQYRTRFGTYGDVGGLEGVGLLDASFSDLQKAGYRFVSATAPSTVQWAIVAEPVNPGVTGDRYFYVDESGVIRYREGAPPTSADPAVE